MSFRVKHSVGTLCFLYSNVSCRVSEWVTLTLLCSRRTDGRWRFGLVTFFSVDVSARRVSCRRHSGWTLCPISSVSTIPRPFPAREHLDIYGGKLNEVNIFEGFVFLARGRTLHFLLISFCDVQRVTTETSRTSEGISRETVVKRPTATRQGQTLREDKYSLNQSQNHLSITQSVDR